MSRISRIKNLEEKVETFEEDLSNIEENMSKTKTKIRNKVMKDISDEISSLRKIVKNELN